MFEKLSILLSDRDEVVGSPETLSTYNVALKGFEIKVFTETDITIST